MCFNIRRFNYLDSTQTALASADKAEHLPQWTVYLAQCQKHGKGQMQNSWESEDGKNLTFSLLLKPLFLQPSEQFHLTQILSLGVTDFLQKYIANEEIKIKWSNDIYIRNKKICGMLVQNIIMGEEFCKAYCGIGLNVNQTLFTSAQNPTSLAMENGRTYDLDMLFSELLEALHKRYEGFDDAAKTKAEYIDRLLYFNQMRHYVYKGEDIDAKIVDVDKYGNLQLETSDNRHIEAEQKEIVFVH
ncbi:MAG: biotin--[acetyl-CoA-carboxylase] ligase [Bacteroidales bacterium]|jgi:BirA family biotin operon repressor/biotin-[acetyl-CoA-carboxylase] ligase|nr:biotin--[acetyl-CoA-carboxylase] ligase [Bacteroidales bacterium]